MFGNTQISYLDTAQNVSNTIQQGQQIYETATDIIESIVPQSSSGSSSGSPVEPVYNILFNKMCKLKKGGQTSQINTVLFQLRTTGQKGLANKLESDLKKCLTISVIPTKNALDKKTVSEIYADRDDSKNTNKILTYAIPIVGALLIYKIFIKK